MNSAKTIKYKLKKLTELELERGIDALCLGEGGREGFGLGGIEGEEIKRLVVAKGGISFFLVVGM